MESERIGQLIYNEEEGRFYIGDVDLHCGDCFEVLVYNSSKEDMEWIKTRIEKGSEWFLVGVVDYQITGLFARI